MANAEPLTGGCLCGAVRFRLAGTPVEPGWCHCRTCQLNSGAPAMAFAAVPRGDYLVDQGEDRIATVASSSHGHRCFCRTCGTPLYMEVDEEPATLDFSLATLDTPDAVVPEFHIYYASRIAWAPAGDDLPKHERARRAAPGA